jgi:hypothetical protein
MLPQDVEDLVPVLKGHASPLFERYALTGQFCFALEQPPG